MVSLKTIAEKCGVSTATVSKALNDQRDISEETKSRVRKTGKYSRLDKKTYFYG